METAAERARAVKVWGDKKRYLTALPTGTTSQTVAVTTAIMEPMMKNLLAIMRMMPQTIMVR